MTLDVLMLVATSVATDSRVLREAASLVDAGHRVHIVGRSVPDEFEPPAGITVSSVGTSSLFRAEGRPTLQGRKLSAPVRFVRWMLLPQHRRSSFARWADGALVDARRRRFDVVHAHDFTALAAGDALARERGVPLVYDSHELWSGMPRQHRPTPLADLRERRAEARLGGRASAVITVGRGVAEALGLRYGWDGVTVVRNTFPFRPDLPQPLAAPTGLVYAGRVSAYRELETIAVASEALGLPVTVCGPADETWLTAFDRRAIEVLPAQSLDDASSLILGAGVALVTHSNQWENHRLALPNKLFHAISLGVPVVATDVGELARTVREHNLGTLYTPSDPVSLHDAVERLRTEYPHLVASVRAARHELSWDVDAQRLVGLYAKLGRKEREGLA